MTLTHCIRCHREDFPMGTICQRPGAEFYDNGTERDVDVARYEGFCLRCCNHNHG